MAEEFTFEQLSRIELQFTFQDTHNATFTRLMLLFAREAQSEDYVSITS